MSGQEKSFDISLWGATGFTGRLIADYIAKVAPKRGAGLRLAVVGRNAATLATIKEAVQSVWNTAQYAGVCEDRVCNTESQNDVDSIVGRSRVVICAAGPFITCATPVVDACVRLGVDYVDICGETPWVKGVIDKYEAAAKDKGVLIVNMCGFDSVPSDLGTWMVVKAIRDRYGCATRRVRCFADMSGSLSGGTINTGMTLERLGGETMAIVNDPFSLGGRPVDGVRADDEDISAIGPAPELNNKWTAPFMMAHINTRVVRRSNALFAQTGHVYGPTFVYNEWALAATEAAAKRLAAAMKVPLATRQQMVIKGMLPKPGQGPTPEQREKSSFAFTLVGEAEDGRSVTGTVAGGDPGYGETARMISEAALLLVFRRGELPTQGGVVTPAFAFGQVLIDRLNECGMTFRVVE